MVFPLNLYNHPDQLKSQLQQSQSRRFIFLDLRRFTDPPESQYEDLLRVTKDAYTFAQSAMRHYFVLRHRYGSSSVPKSVFSQYVFGDIATVEELETAKLSVIELIRLYHFFQYQQFRYLAKTYFTDSDAFDESPYKNDSAVKALNHIAWRYAVLLLNNIKSQCAFTHLLLQSKRPPDFAFVLITDLPWFLANGLARLVASTGNPAFVLANPSGDINTLLLRWLAAHTKLFIGARYCLHTLEPFMIQAESYCSKTTKIYLVNPNKSDREALKKPDRERRYLILSNTESFRIFTNSNGRFIEDEF